MNGPPWITRSPEETRAWGRGLPGLLPRPGVVRLSGDLGAGKTCLVQGLAEQLGWTGPVTSPTYGLVQEFDTDPPLVHADLYRLKDPSEIWGLGLEEWLEEEAWLAVEWSERAPAFWPASAWTVRLDFLNEGPDLRRISLIPPEAGA